MTVLRFDDNRGGLVYPFLPDVWQWQIVSRPLAGPSETEGDIPAPPTPPTLRWVKDDKVLDLFVPGMDTEAFLQQTGLRLSLAKGGYVLSKRLSRIMRPYRYAQFFAAHEVVIEYDPALNGRLWDGCGQVSRGFVQRLAEELELDDHHRRELLTSSRFEVTTLHSSGQDKGHVLVVDDLAVDFLFPAGSAKQELALDNGRVFVGLQPVHSQDEMCLDIQSLINLHPFFQPEHLLAWAGMESELFLAGIKDGRLAKVWGRLYDVDSVSDLDGLSAWHVGEYIASGGQLMWFAGMVKAVAKQHLKRLGSRASKLRCPIPGGRYYLFPAAVGDREVSPGQVELDQACATAWVSDADWLSYIVDVLGGCDGDDAVWAFPFADTSDAGRQKLLLWRSPNQVGEYVVLEPTTASHAIAWETVHGSLPLPKMSSRLLPDRVDRVGYQYGRLAAAGGYGNKTEESYTTAALSSTSTRAATNQGVLGGYCNVLMVCKAIYGKLPTTLPATLEAVIDGSVKTGLDLTPVQAWNEMALTRMVQHGQVNARRAMPQALLERLPVWLRAQAQPAAGHWLDTLTQALEQHKAQYWADVEALACAACPPVALFEQGRAWLAVGKELRQMYSQALRQGLDLAQTAACCERFLEQWSQPWCGLIGAAAYLYAQGPQDGGPVRDGVLWQLGQKRVGQGREPGLAQQMIAALRQIGLLGEPVWTTVGAVLHYADAPCPQRCGVPVRLNGVWFNYAKVMNHNAYASMSQMPVTERNQAKARIAALAQDGFRGMQLTTQVTDENRVVAHTPQGNLFGYVQREHELLAVRESVWQIAWATAVDGNVWAVLEPVPEVHAGV